MSRIKELSLLALILWPLLGCAQVAGVTGDYYERTDASIEQSGGDGAGKEDAAEAKAPSDGAVDAGCDAGATPIGVNGQRCCTPNELACAGNAQKLVLICDPTSHTWVPLQACSGQQLCDTQVGTTQGTCQDPVPLCVGKKPGDKVCNGNNVVVCGPDLVTSTETACPGTCKDGACAGQCKSGSRQCSGLTPQFCNSDGTWQSEAPCPFACVAGECKGVCVEGDKQCEGQVPQSCDASGQWQSGPACTGACIGGVCSGTCSPLDTRCDNLVPQVCNAQGAWTNGAPCAYLCTNGNCSGVCTPGAKRCTGKTPQLCDTKGQWQDGTVCPAECSAGQCVAACNNGEKQCSGDTVPQTCVSGSWQNGPACANACLDGVCTGVCVPGTEQCIGLTPQSCDAKGAWQNGEACPFLCSDGECSGVCKPGDKRCMSLTAQTCNAAGQWQDDQTCAFVCNSGACTGVCVPGGKQCTGLNPETCDVSGQWQAGAACQYVCTAGSCTGLCQPQAKQCVGLTPQVCDATGQWTSQAPCTYVCGDGSCTGVCSPGGQQCNGLVPQSCSSAGQWQDGIACPYACSGGTCTGACNPGSKQCNGLVPQTCDTQGTWQNGASCAYVCSGGNCTGVCTPTTKQCYGQVPRTCDSAGQWQSGAACPFICVAGVCQGVCSPGTTQCQGNGVQTCNAGGQWGVATACTSPAVCSTGVCVNPPPAPTVQFVADLTACTQVTATLTWSAVTGQGGDAVEYYVEVDDDPAFATVNKSSGWISATSWQVVLPTYYTYYWHVRARDAIHPTAVSTWSATDSFAAIDCAASCPLVYAWQGQSFVYETDIQGEIVGQKWPNPGVPLYGPSHVVLDHLVADQAGVLKLKLREAQRETSYADLLRLFAVDVPDGLELVSSQAENTYFLGYAKPFELYTLNGARVPLAATDQSNTDVLASLSAKDGIPAPVQPLALNNYYTLDFGPVSDAAHLKLVLDAWSAYDVHAEIEEINPSIEVQDANNAWVKVPIQFGFTSGDFKTMVVQIPNPFLSASRLIRLNLGSRDDDAWVIDRIRLDESAPVAVEMTELEARAATLRYRGKPTYGSATYEHRMWALDDAGPDDPQCYGYGHYTRYGPVSPLVEELDDTYAILRHGDELEFSFLDLAPPVAGLTRKYVLKADVFYNEHVASPLVEPLPFHGMSQYPYPAPEAYPSDAFHLYYVQNYNTRFYPLP